MFLERVLKFCIKTWIGSCTMLLLIYVFLWNWTWILSFNEEYFCLICTIASYKNISMLEIGIQMQFISEGIQTHMVLLSMFYFILLCELAFIYFVIIDVCISSYNNLFYLSLLNVQELLFFIYICVNDI